MSESVSQDVMQIVAKQFKLDIKQLDLKTRLIEDLAADSLDRVDLTVSIERAFGFYVEDGVPEKWITVSDVIQTCIRQT